MGGERQLPDLIKESAESKTSAEKYWRDNDFEMALENYKRHVALLLLYKQKASSIDSNSFKNMLVLIEEKIQIGKKCIECVSRKQKYQTETQSVTENGKSDKDDTDCAQESDPEAQKLYEQIKSYVVLDKPNVHFSDIIGCDDVIRDLYTFVITPLRYPEIYIGISRITCNFLLHGPPGTGKTLLLQAVACEIDAVFLQLSAAQLKNKYVGESEKTIAAIFKFARNEAKTKPVILFIDEVDSVAMRRGGDSGSSNSSTLNQLLIELDGFGSSSNIYMFCATNRPFDLDDALLRRLQRKFFMSLPDFEARVKLFKLFLINENDPLQPRLRDEDYEDLANRTNNYSPADISNLCQACRVSCADKTTHSTHFGLFNVNGKEMYVPVPPNFNGALETPLDELPKDKICRMPVDLETINEQLKIYKKGIRDENISLYKDFQDSID